MTTTTLHIALQCGARALNLGPGEALDINKITGLESSELEVGLSDLATVDGSSLDGKHIKARPIHLEGSFRNLSDPAGKREQLVRFFNPKLTGTLTATIRSGDSAITRAIEYELEGWTVKERRNLDARVGFVADFVCPDPYFFGAEIHPNGWNQINNDGDVEAGWRATIKGPATNPGVYNTKTGEFMRIRATITRDDLLIISTEDRKQTITLNDDSSFRLIDRASTPFKLQPGLNVLEIKADSGTPSGEISFRERYFGI